MNNILSLFHGYLGMLMDDKKLDPVTREALAKIKDGARSATELIERTNHLVKPTSAVWRELRMADLLRQLRPTFERFCPPKVRIQVECEDELPLVWADASRLRIALVELVRNACEAAVRQVTIRVRAEEGRVQGELFEAVAEEPEHWLTISVIDDGPGLNMGEIDRIYAPFYSTKKQQQNAGLGLTVALCCVQQIQGSLQYCTREGQTCFELTVPTRVACSDVLGAVA